MLNCKFYTLGWSDSATFIPVVFSLVITVVFKWLNRRGQKKVYEWNGFNQMLKIYKLPLPKIKVNIYAT